MMQTHFQLCLDTRKRKPPCEEFYVHDHTTEFPPWN